MALYDNLPVFKSAYDLHLHLYGACRNMERDYKFTIGERLKNEAVELIINIYRANARGHKTPMLEAARENAEVIRLLLRSLSDLKQMNLDRFVGISQKLESVSKQLAAWQKSQK
jgi:hypothetical protein